MEYTIITVISNIIIGLITNYIYDKVKSHPNATKGGFKLDVKIKFRSKK